ncbi:hypothetical protein B0T18DRAFT_58061 [Schizothecium vesticola]|uniref:C2H2-type domain-containing protein n=1 Tax=Schizothecium vesticola TaxID=314040 RepID=A0AA40F437_9PEZI|nr:hypothetical protein B0T18DRAFT_58061 [Schizothecium vesticola]
MSPKLPSTTEERDNGLTSCYNFNMASSLPEGWEADYDGDQWFYRHRTTGLVQFTFPDPGDEHTWYGTSSPPAERLPEENLLSSPQVKKTNTADQTGTASNETPDGLDEGVTSATLPLGESSHYPLPRRRYGIVVQPSSDGEKTGNTHEPATGKDKAVSRADEGENGIWDSGTPTRSERDGLNPTLIPAKDPSSATAATEKANTSHVCPHCHREYPRLCDLIKHAKSHSRPYKCVVQSCKDHDLGWSTARDLERHVIAAHSATPRTFPCAFPSCTYESKRESNCRQHMEKKHGWTYVRSKSAGKQLGSQHTTEDPIQPSEMPLGRLYSNQSYADITRATDDSPLEILGSMDRMQRIVGNLASREDIFDDQWSLAGFHRTPTPDASRSKAGLYMSIFNFDTESSVGPSAWNEGRTTNDSAAPASNAGDGTVQSQETNSQLVVEELSDFTDGNTEQPGIIRRDAVEDQDSEHSKGNSPRHPEKLPLERAEFGRLRRRTNPASKHPPPSVPELEKPDSSSDRDDFPIPDTLKRELPHYQWHTTETDSEPTGYDDAFRRGPAEGHGDTKKVRHWLEARSKSQDGGSRSPLPLGTRRISGKGGSARDHFLYKNAYPQADGLFHCPWEGETTCNHKAEKLKCNYEYVSRYSLSDDQSIDHSAASSSTLT